MSGSALLDSVERHTRLAGHNSVGMLVFTLGDAAWFGMNVFKVLEVLRKPVLARMPDMHALLAGSFDYRGATIPVIDLAQALGYPPLAAAQQAHVVVTEFKRSVQGFLVAGFQRIVYCDGGSLAAPPPALGLDHRISATTRVDGRMLAVVDLEYVLSGIWNDTVRASPTLLEQARQQLQGRRILLVDDSLVARRQLLQLFEPLRLECLVAHDGQEALERLRAQDDKAGAPIELVLSDIEMPRLDGYALTRAIRDTPALRKTKVLLHSSLSGSFNQALTSDVGADRFIAKFQSDLLIEAMLELMPPSTN